MASPKLAIARHPTWLEFRRSSRRMWPVLLIAALIPAHFRGIVEVLVGELVSNALAVTGLAAAALILFISRRDTSRASYLVLIFVIAGIASALLTLAAGRVEFVVYYAVPFLAIGATAMACLAMSRLTWRNALRTEGGVTLESYLAIYVLLSIAAQVLEMGVGEALLPGTHLQGGEVVRSAALTGAMQVHAIQMAVLAILFCVRGLEAGPGRGRTLRLALALLLAGASLFTYTRAGVFILIVFGALISLMRPRWAVALATGAVALSIVLWIASPAYLERVMSIVDLTSDSNAERLAAWQDTFTRLGQTPLLLSDRFGSASQATRPFWPDHGGGHGENFFWSFMVNIGIPGALAFYAVLLIAAKRIGPLMFVFMIALLVQSMTYMTLESSAVLATLLLVTILWPVERRHAGDTPRTGGVEAAAPP